jgi:[ribosomal protein S18]-alanine N-acetyltransferase
MPVDETDAVAKPSPRIRIRPMTVDDLPEVLAIEVISFSVPWTGEMFLNELARGNLAEILVAQLPEAGDRAPLAGYICLWGVSEELHINNLAVHPRLRSRGVGTALLEAGLDFGRARGARAAFLEVRASNQTAQMLYRRYRFVPTGVRPRYYTHPVEDALLMRRERL